jgi:hypothetical protein
MTTLSNTEIKELDDKLRIYNRNFFTVINPAGGLLSETTSIKDNTSLSIPDAGGTTAAYSIGQFATFIRKIVNFSIKDYSEATLTDTELCFVKKTAGGTPSSNDANRDHIIKTLKVINVFVDILEAYKYCIDTEEDASLISGYTQSGNIDIIEIVSDKIRFYSGASNGTMTPSADNRNVGYIRTVSHSGVNKNVLFLSIQSFDTGMTSANNIYNYDELFTKSGGTYTDNTNILDTTAKGALAVVSQTTQNYKYQRYTDNDTIIPSSGLTLDARNKSLIVLLIRTLFNLDTTNRKQSVSALYYYYKFVQLYSTFIIHVSNVMYNDVKLTSEETSSPYRIETYNMTTNKKTHGISAIERQFIGAATTAVAVSYQITKVGPTTPTVPASISDDATTGGTITIAVSTAGSGYDAAPTVVIDDIAGATKPTATPVMGNKIDRIDLGFTTGTTPGTGYIDGKTRVQATANGGEELRAASFTLTISGGDITGVTVVDGGVYTGGAPTISFIGTGTGAGTGRTGTAVMSNKKSVGRVTVSGGSGYKTAPRISFTSGGGSGAEAIATLSNGAYAYTDSSRGSITRGKGYLQNPSITLNPSTYETARATIVPVVYSQAISNEYNIKRLADVISEINETITSLQNELTASTYSKTPVIQITTSISGDTGVFKSSDKYVVIKVTKATIYNSLKEFKGKYDLEKDYIIYDKINKYSYNILKATDVNSNNFQIEIDAVFLETDKANTTQFKKQDNQPITITASITDAAPFDISYANEFLELRLKDTNTYKGDYIKTRGELSVLETDINFKSSKVTHQNNLYQSQNNKKIFLERQVLAYNIILAIIVIILVAINVVKVDKEVVKTVSLSCFGAIILLFVIYFISNLTYIETFASVPSDLLYDLSFPSYTADTTGYTIKKINKLKEVIKDLNTRFIGYFEKLIITLPASENYDFYKEIYGIIENDKENKDFINTNLDYSKNQNDNNINSIKYELENNKLYINTLLISAVIFVGLYNLYINYITDDKYLSLLIFVCVIIFVIIVSYYYITANRRVKTVFKSIYWGPEFSKRF